MLFPNYSYFAPNISALFLTLVVFWNNYISLSMKKQLVCTIVFVFSFTMGIAFSQAQASPFLVKDSVRMENLLDSIETHIYVNNKQKAYELTLRGLKTFDTTSYQQGKVKLLQRAATLNSLYGMSLDSGVFYLNQMRTLSSQIGFKRGLLWYEQTFGQIYLMQKDYEKAYRFYRGAYQLAVDIDDSIAMADVLPYIALMQINNGHYDSAYVSIRRALPMVRRFGMSRTEIMLYDRLARILKDEQQLDSAAFYYKQSLEVAQSINSKLGTLTASFNLTHLRFLKDRYADIENDLTFLLAQMKQHELLNVYIAGSYILSDVLESQKKYKKALGLYKQTRLFEDSLIGNDRVRMVVERESDFYLNLKEIENLQLKKDGEIRELQLRNRKLVIYFTSFSLLALFILLINIVKKYRVIQQNIKTIREKDRIIFEQDMAIMEKEKEKIEQMVEAQRKENTTKLMRIYNYQEIARSTTEELLKLKREIVGTGRQAGKVSSAIQNIINTINAHNQEHLWSEFETSFNETDPDYLNRLAARFPDLTPNELKLCIFLKLNLRTKEISVITQQSLKSIEVGRTRLRKKLGIDNTNTNIASFLQQV